MRFPSISVNPIQYAIVPSWPYAPYDEFEGAFQVRFVVNQELSVASLIVTKCPPIDMELLSASDQEIYSLMYKSYFY